MLANIYWMSLLSSQNENIMQIRIEKKISKDLDFDKEYCLKSLSEFGLRITDSEKMTFTETYNFTTDSGMNKSKVFHSLLQGHIQIDNENSKIRWHLNIDGIIFKAVLLCILAIFGQITFMQVDWINSLMVGGFIGTIIFIINGISLDTRVNIITEKINKKLNCTNK